MQGYALLIILLFVFSIISKLKEEANKKQKADKARRAFEQMQEAHGSLHNAGGKTYAKAKRTLDNHAKAAHTAEAKKRETLTKAAEINKIPEQPSFNKDSAYNTKKEGYAEQALKKAKKHTANSYEERHTPSAHSNVSTYQKRRAGFPLHVNAGDLANAVIMSEVLDKPVSLRDKHLF